MCHRALRRNRRIELSTAPTAAAAVAVWPLCCCSGTQAGEPEPEPEEASEPPPEDHHAKKGNLAKMVRTPFNRNRAAGGSAGKDSGSLSGWGHVAHKQALAVGADRAVRRGRPDWTYPAAPRLCTRTCRWRHRWTRTRTRRSRRYVYRIASHRIAVPLKIDWQSYTRL
jgi:hypothetical protein